MILPQMPTNARCRHNLQAGKNSWSVLFVLLFFGLCPVYSQGPELAIKRDLKGNITQNYTSQGTGFSIASHKSRYQVGEDILLLLRVKNIGNYPITLYIHKNHLLNFTIIVRDEKGRNLPIKDSVYQAKKNPTEDPFFRDHTGTRHNYRAIILQPDETFEKEIVLQEIVDIQKQASTIEKFQIQAYFYPNPEQAGTIFLKSNNHYTIFIDPEESRYTAQRVGIYDDEASITPKEVVYLALSAEYSREWKNFFRYVSIPDLIKDYPEYARRYVRAPENQKAVVLDGFRSYLKGEDFHRLLRFHIIPNKKNEYLRKRSSETATVQAEATREIEGFRRRFLYTYYLTKAQTLWKITGIESQVLE